MTCARLQYSAPPGRGRAAGAASAGSWSDQRASVPAEIILGLVWVRSLDNAGLVVGHGRPHKLLHLTGKV